MYRQKLIRLLDRLGPVSEELEAIYREGIEDSGLIGPQRGAANDNASELMVACEAIDDAINALTRALIDV